MVIRWVVVVGSLFFSRCTRHKTHTFVIYNLLGFKKYYSHKISSMHHLRKVVVENFLNVLSVTAIIMLMIMLTVGMANHVR